MTHDEVSGGLSGDKARLKRWLAATGSDISGLDIGASPAGPGAGLSLTRSHDAAVAGGWLSRAWHWLRPASDDVTIAAFPLVTTVSAATATQHPLLGPDFQRLLQEGALDDRAAVMLLLLIERKREERSPLAPWLNLLPRDFGTPLHFEEEELNELRGTTLHAATRVKQEQLPKVWARLQPIAHDLLRKAGETADATYSDFVWAFSIFWSRAQNLPTSGVLADEVTEALVPGLDFCNHAAGPTCRWELQGDQVVLVAPRRWQPAPGTELAITYGDKSNEELLFHYGFVEDANPHDVLMVACPLPPMEEWGEEMHARAALLAAQDLTPQLFLPRPQPSHRDLPPEAFATLAALVMDPPQLAAALRRAEAQHSEETFSAIKTAAGPTADAGGQPAAASEAGGGQQEAAAAAGLRMAVLTSAARLLEAKVAEMEGPDGTGPLEQDVAHLSQMRLPSSVRACLVYRAGQKRIARDWLAIANRLLQQQLAA